MTDAIHTPPAASKEVMAAPPFYPWRDAYGREHPDIPRCVGETRPRNSWSKSQTWRDCQRKGVVKRGTYAGREAWFCLQHDPARHDERRVAELAPVFMDLLRQALDLIPRTKRSSDWLRRAEAVLAKAEGPRL